MTYLRYVVRTFRCVRICCTGGGNVNNRVYIFVWRTVGIKLSKSRCVLWNWLWLDGLKEEMVFACILKALLKVISPREKRNQGVHCYDLRYTVRRYNNITRVYARPRCTRLQFDFVLNERWLLIYCKSSF